jgi:hypothetical protein
MLHKFLSRFGIVMNCYSYSTVKQLIQAIYQSPYEPRLFGGPEFWSLI